MKKNIALWVGIFLMVLGIGHIVYMEYWVYGDVSRYMLTPIKRLDIFWRGTLALFVGSILFKFGSSD